MLNQDPIPTLTPELVLDPLDDYPEQVLECEWNPALEQVLRLRKKRRIPGTGPALYAEPPAARSPSD